jgi:hypothetical protein
MQEILFTETLGRAGQSASQPQRKEEKMDNARLVASFVALLGAILISGCADLEVVDPGVVPPYCDYTPGGILVEIQNRGPFEAPQSTTTVNFLPGGPVNLLTPAISAGTSTVVGPFPFPLGCFNPDCDFEISADSAGAIVETDEINNFAEGWCLG